MTANSFITRHTVLPVICIRLGYRRHKNLDSLAQHIQGVSHDDGIAFRHANCASKLRSKSEVVHTALQMHAYTSSHRQTGDTPACKGVGAALGCV